MCNTFNDSDAVSDADYDSKRVDVHDAVSNPHALCSTEYTFIRCNSDADKALKPYVFAVDEPLAEQYTDGYIQLVAIAFPGRSAFVSYSTATIRT
jgi:hypothetical protein